MYLYVQIDSLQFVVFSWRLHPLGIVGKISCWWEYTLLLQIQEWCSLSFLFDQRPPVQLPSVGKEKNFNSRDEKMLSMRGSRIFLLGEGINLFFRAGGGDWELFFKSNFIMCICWIFYGGDGPFSRPHTHSSWSAHALYCEKNIQ